MRLFSRSYKTDAVVSPEYRESRREFPVKTVRKLNEWCTLKSIEKNDEDYYFLERIGVDSVAFILFDSKKRGTPFGLINQYRGNFGEWQIGCFTGSLDKPELTLPQIVVEEVKEESGFIIDESNVNFISCECAGSQSNERVHLYLVDVSHAELGETEPESEHEENTDTLWLDEAGVMSSDDWKAKLILMTCIRDGRLVSTI